ncbi:TetR/AcrR family transcriptional regulator [Erysipelotrichaceae bacterium Oil+RF-744-GAM-WT-6]|uniref:TetR/AcrR family transcriptional regulator n=1 Tax=Stecheria intestinalis TaxID=2606630 RepID=A0A7X2TGF5_9FIRM|nr:TetR/AcrR family transcriptional regulator [Stecheria intestinalis]
MRKEEFIHAAEQLFLEKGYEHVSIRNVLDAVGNKTASPSVFYYYFSSRDVLYHACIEAAGMLISRNGKKLSAILPEPWKIC